MRRPASSRRGLCRAILPSGRRCPHRAGFMVKNGHGKRHAAPDHDLCPRCFDRLHQHNRAMRLTMTDHNGEAAIDAAVKGFHDGLAAAGAAARFGVNGGAHQPAAPSAREIELRFTYIPPSELQIQRLVLLRDRFRALAQEIVALTPASREQSEALTCLETANMFANASIVRRE